MGRPARGGGRPHRAVDRRRTGPGRGQRLHHGQPVQAGHGGRRRPGRPALIVGDAEDFPTVRYVLQGIAAQRSAASGSYRLTSSAIVTARPSSGRPAAVGPLPPSATARGRIALVCLSAVNYRSGAVVDMASVTSAAHRAGRSHALGPEPRGRRGTGRPRRRRRRPGRRLQLQVPQRGAGRARLGVRAVRAAGLPAPTDLGLVGPTRPVRHGRRLTTPSPSIGQVPGRHAGRVRHRRRRLRDHAPAGRRAAGAMGQDPPPGRPAGPAGRRAARAPRRHGSPARLTRTGGAAIWPCPIPTRTTPPASSSSEDWSSPTSGLPTCSAWPRWLFTPASSEVWDAVEHIASVLADPAVHAVVARKRVT